MVRVRVTECGESTVHGERACAGVAEAEHFHRDDAVAFRAVDVLLGVFDAGVVAYAGEICWSGHEFAGDAA